MAQTIAQLMVEVGADTSGATNALGGLDKIVAGATAKGIVGAQALSGAANSITDAFLGTIGTASDFEASMSGIKAVMSPGDVQQFGGALHDLALTLGKETVFTSREAAGGIEELIKAGIPAEAVLGGAAKSALALAAATGVPVADAATIAAQAMNAFQVPVEGLTHTVDFLSGTVNASAADMTDLKFGLQSVGAVASTVGLSFDDTATALGLFANNGLRGQDAGTSLKTMLLNLQPSTKKQAALFQQLGIITEDGANQFFDATGKAKNLAGIADVLQTALAGQTDQQKLANLQTLFGTDAMRAGAIIAKEGAAGVNKLTTEIGKISAADAAKTRLDNFAGSVNQLKGSMETLAITMGERVLPFLRILADTATQLVNNFLGLPEPVQTAIAAIAAIGAIALVAVVGIGLFVAALGAALPVLGAAAALIGAAIVPLLIITAAVALLALAWTNNWGDIQGKTAEAVTFMTGVLSNLGDFVINTLVPAFQTALGNLGDLFTNTLVPAFSTAAGFIRDNVLPFFISLADLGFAKVQAAVQNLVNFWNSAFLPALQATGDFFNQFVLPPLQALADFIGNTLKPLLDGLGGLLGPIGQNLQNVFAGVGANAAPNLQAATAAIQAEAASTRAQAGIQTNINAPLVGQVTVTNEADENRLIDKIAAVLDSAENRVVPPQPILGAGAF